MVTCFLIYFFYSQNCVDAYPTFLVVLWSAGLLCSQGNRVLSVFSVWNVPEEAPVQVLCWKEFVWPPALICETLERCGLAVFPVLYASGLVDNALLMLAPCSWECLHWQGWFKAKCDSESVSSVSSDIRALSMRVPEGSILGLLSLGPPANKLPGWQSSLGPCLQSLRLVSRSPAFLSYQQPTVLTSASWLPRVDLKLNGNQSNIFFVPFGHWHYVREKGGMTWSAKQSVSEEVTSVLWWTI